VITSFSRLFTTSSYDVYTSSILTIYPIANLSYTLYISYFMALRAMKLLVVNTMDQHSRNAL